MYFKILALCAVIAAANAGYLQPGLRYAAPAAYGFAAAAPSISYAAPAISRVEHLGPSLATGYKTDVFTAPIARTSVIAPPTVHTVAAAPLVAAPVIHAASLYRTGYLGHNSGYAAPSAAFGYAKSAPLTYGGVYRAGW